jgi:hypothetical protein
MLGRYCEKLQVTDRSSGGLYWIDGCFVVFLCDIVEDISLNTRPDGTYSFDREVEARELFEVNRVCSSRLGDGSKAVVVSSEKSEVLRMQKLD